MSDEPAADGTPEGTPATGRRRWGAHFSPHLLVFIATLALASRPLKGAIIAGVFWWWGDTYQQVEFVMDDAQVNDGYPFIDGRVEGVPDVTRVTGMMVGDAIAPDGAPQETFAPGKRLLIWRSPTAPDFGVEGASVNEFAVSARPELPGLPTFLAYLAATYIFLRAGFWATAWVAARWARRWGEIDTTRRRRIGS